MKILLAGLLLLGFVINANATFINNGDNTITDDSNGLQWLQLTATRNLTYADALTANQASGWRYASNDEIVAMFDYFFPTFVANSSNGASQYSYRYSGGYSSCGFGGSCWTSTSSSTPDSAYTRAQQDADIVNWNTIFYKTNSSYYSSGSSSSTLGFYVDEAGVLRQLGTSQSSYYYSSSYSSSSGNNSNVYGPDFTYAPAADVFSASIGTFLVRDISVPEASSLYLLAFGLVGLLAVRRNA